jgi:mono/diheme cytochrome c family protein
MMAVVVAIAAEPAKPASKAAAASVERGRYLIKITGCNDCHTAGYAPSDGKTPESEWLLGDELGWKGPWGTTYPANLRLRLAAMSEDHWVKVAKTAQFRPPMPWFNLHGMSEPDLRDIYRYVRSLGAAGKPAPAYVPPGVDPRGPVVTFPEAPQQLTSSEPAR